MGRIYVLCVAGHKTKTAKTLSCGFFFYHGLDGLDGLDGFEGFAPIETLDTIQTLTGPKDKNIKNT